jgi:hypothetical protein
MRANIRLDAMVPPFAETIDDNNVLGALEGAVFGPIFDYLVSKTRSNAGQGHKGLGIGAIQINANAIFWFACPVRLVRRCNTAILRRSIGGSI